MENNNFKKDAGEDSIYLSEIFNEIETEMIKNEKALPTFRKVLNINKTKNTFAESHTYRFYEARGQAAIMRGDSDVAPRISEVGGRSTVQIKEVYFEIPVSHTELASAKAGMEDITGDRSKSAKDAVEAGLDRLAALGDGEQKGLLNTDGVAIDDLSVAGTLDGWVANSRTAAECLETIQNAITAVHEATNYIEKPDTLILPVPAYTYLLNISSGEGSLSLTGMQMVQRRFPELKIEMWQYCNAGQAVSNSRAVVFDSRDDRVHMLMAQEIDRGEFVPNGTKGFITKCSARSGGCTILKKAAVRYIDDL